MPLQLTTKSTHYVRASALEQFVRETYPGTKYSFAADQLTGDDEVCSFVVTDDPNDIWFPNDLKAFIEGGPAENLTGDILTDLCCRGLIPAGTYDIKT